MQKNLRSLETVMNDELLKIVDWLTANKLSLNVKKTNYIIFHPYQKHLNYDINIKILDSRVNKFFNLERKEYVKYLGVTIVVMWDTGRHFSFNFPFILFSFIFLLIFYFSPEKKLIKYP